MSIPIFNSKNKLKSKLNHKLKLSPFSKSLTKSLVIAISGTPGTGKSTLAKILVKKIKLYHLDLHHHYQELAFSFNKKKDCYDLNLKKVEQLLKQKIKEHPEGIVLDSHIAHLLSPKIISFCIILTCTDLKKLHQRLAQRHYHKEKIQENIEAEIFQVCLEEAQQKKHHLLIFDTSHNELKKLPSQNLILHKIIKFAKDL